MARNHLPCWNRVLFLSCLRRACCCCYCRPLKIQDKRGLIDFLKEWRGVGYGLRHGSHCLLLLKLHRSDYKKTAVYGNTSLRTSRRQVYHCRSDLVRWRSSGSKWVKFEKRVWSVNKWEEVAKDKTRPSILKQQLIVLTLLTPSSIISHWSLSCIIIGTLHSPHSVCLSLLCYRFTFFG